MILIPTSTSENLARRVGERVGAKVITPQRKRFPDGELYVRIPKFEGRAVVIGSTHQPDSNWIELLLTVDAVRRTAKEVDVVIPYYGYGRQDKVFLQGEPISAEVFARALSSLDVSKIYTVEAHFYRREGTFRDWGIDIENLSAYRPIGEFLKERSIERVVAPDEGAAWFARRVAEVAGAELAVFKKRRDRITGRLTMEGVKVEEQAAIVDDIIGSGGTMLLASRWVEDPLFMAVHGVFSPGWERLKERGEVIVSDTIERKESRVSVAGIIAEALSKE